MGGGASGDRHGAGVLKNDVKQQYARISVSLPCGCHHLSGPKRVKKSQADSGVLKPSSLSVFVTPKVKTVPLDHSNMSLIVRTRTRSRLHLSRCTPPLCLLA